MEAASGNRHFIKRHGHTSGFFTHCTQSAHAGLSAVFFETQYLTYRLGLIIGLACAWQRRRIPRRGSVEIRIHAGKFGGGGDLAGKEKDFYSAAVVSFSQMVSFTRIFWRNSWLTSAIGNWF